MSRIGKLEQVSDNTVLIDGVWYDASAVIKYIPKSVGIQVEYGADENNVLQFIRAKRAFTPKGTSSAPFKKKGTYTPKNIGKYVDKSESICKQLLLKVSASVISSFTFGSPEEAQEALDDTYKKLKDKYLTDLIK